MAETVAKKIFCPGYIERKCILMKGPILMPISQVIHVYIQPKASQMCHKAYLRCLGMRKFWKWANTS